MLKRLRRGWARRGKGILGRKQQKSGWRQLAMHPLRAEPLEPRWLLNGATLVISELMANNNHTLPDSTGQFYDWIEIHNRTANTVTLDGWSLTDDPQNLSQWTFPDTTPNPDVTLGPNGYMVVFASGKDRRLDPQGHPVSEFHTNFNLKAGGEYLALVQPDGTTVESDFGAGFPAQVADVSYGWSQDMTTKGYFASPTPREPNGNQTLVDPGKQVVVDEIMYHPGFGDYGEAGYVAEDTRLEYVELYNQGAEAVNLAGWQFTHGVQFTIPNVAAATVPSNGYLVVASDAAAFHAKYPAVTNYVGGWTGDLPNNNGKITLADSLGNTIDSVTYASEGDWALRRQGEPYPGHSTWWRGWTWSSGADAGGKSLELIDPNMPNDYGQNWAASAPDGGTPGGPNSVASSDIAPLVLDVTHFPVIPKSTDPVTITAQVMDELNTGVTVSLYYRVDQAWNVQPLPFSTATMHDDGLAGDAVAGDGVYSVVLPAYAENTTIEFYVQAGDVLGHTRTWPGPADDAGTQGANALYQVDNATYTGNQPIYRLITTQRDWHDWTNLMDNVGGGQYSDAQMNATFISIDGTGTEARYDASVRNRGAGTRTAHPHNLQINVPNDQPWENLARIEFNTRTVQSQVAGNALFNMAGLLNTYGTPVQVRINGANLANPTPTGGTDTFQFGSYYRFEPYSGEWADEHMPEDSEGNIYKGVWYFDGASLTNPADLRYVGTNVNSYRQFYGPSGPSSSAGAYSRQNNSSNDDWSDLINLVDVLNNAPDATYVHDVSQVVNVDQWLRYFAVNSLIGNMETTIGTGIGDDYSMYRGVNDTRFQLLIHDLDTVLGQGDTGADINRSIFKAADNAAVSRFLKNPTFAAQYYAVLKDLINTTFAPANVNPLLDQVLGGWVTPSYIQSMKDFVVQRDAAVLTQIPLSLSITSPETVQNGYPRTTNATTSLTGKANAIDTRSIRVNGVAATWMAWTASWSASNIALNPGINRVLVQAFDGNGSEIDRSYIDVWRDTGAGTSVSGTISANTTWTPAGGPYNVTANLTIASGATLTIEPGTAVYLASGVGITVASGGRLLADGTDTQRIVITRAPASASNWGGITIDGGAGTPETQISYTHIVYNGTTAIHSSGGTLFLDHLTFGTASSQYVSLDSSSFVVQDSEFPAPSAGFEPVHGTGGIKAGGRGIFLRNFWGATNGYNDSVDFTGGNRPGQPIVQFINNVFAGASDDNIDLDGTDAWVQGNIFLHVHKNGSPDTSSGVSGGEDSGNTSQVTVIDNIFYDVDQAAMAKQGNFFTLINNTIVHQTHVGGLDTDGAVICMQDNDMTEGLGMYLEGNIVYDAEKLVRNQVSSVVTFNNNLMSLTWSGPGTGNSLGIPLFEHVPQMAETVFTNWKQAQVMRRWLGLRPDSPAVDTGPNGIDKGGVTLLGASVSGEPSGVTDQTAATLTVGVNRTGYSIPAAGWPNGSGYTAYKWRLDGGAWSAETPIGTPISLTGLGNGQHQVDVIGKNDAGTYQNDPALGSDAVITHSPAWTVNTSLLQVPNVIINEVLADNVAAVPHNAAPNSVTYPDVIELLNNGTGTMNLGDMSLSDDPLVPRKFVFAAGTTLGQGQYMLLYGGTDTVTPQDHLGFALDKSGDSLYLYNSPLGGGALVDSVSFGMQLPDRSIGRRSDGTWGLAQPTLGGANAALRTGDPTALKINEWLADEKVAFTDDFVELYNPDPLPVDMGGLYLTDQPAVLPHAAYLHEQNPALAAPYQIPALSFIDAGAFVNGQPVGAVAVFTADGKATKGGDHVDFKLRPFQGMIGLFGADLKPVDTILYGPQTTDVSQGRTPLGAATYAIELVPTPGLENTGVTYGGNVTEVTTPVIGSMTQSWHYLASAVDPNLPSAWTQYEPQTSETWPSGAGLLYLETNTAVTPRTTALPPYSPNLPYKTYYFRTHFTYSGDLSSVTSFTLTARVDDGALLYLNGVPFFNIRMPASGVTYATYTQNGATPPGGDATADELFTVTATPEIKAALRNGDNVLAAEVHQCNATSSDIVWGCRLGVNTTTGVTILREVTTPANITNLYNNLRVSEVMYNPAYNSDLEYIELQNTGATTLNLGGVRFTQGIDFTFPDMLVGPGQYVVVVRNQEAFYSHYGSGANVAGEYKGSLNNAGEQLVLQLPAPYDAAILRFNYNNTWYPTTDGSGYALAIRDLALPAAAWGQASAWQAGTVLGGSPGRADGASLASGIVINEVLTHTDPPLFDSIELYNTTSQDVPIGGWYLSDSTNDYKKFRIPDGTVIPAHQYMVFDQQQFGISEYAWDAEAITGTATDEDAGATLHLVGSAWRKLSLPYMITPSTVLEFDYRSPVEGGVQGIGFDTDSTASPLTIFQLYGTQSWGLGNYDNYASSAPGWKHYSIPVGQFFTGAMNYLVFANGQGGGGQSAESYFRNVSVHEAGSGTPLNFSKFFALDAAHGDSVWLVRADGSGNLTQFADYAAFGAAANGESFGRWQDDQGHWHMAPMKGRTLGQANDTAGNGPRIGPLVVSEVMYNPPYPGGGVNPNDLKYIEVYNPTGATVSLDHWRIRKGVDFDFPTGTTLDPGQALLVVGFDPLNLTKLGAFRTHYGLSTSVKIVGPYSGSLSAKEQTVQLQRPDEPPLGEPNFWPGLLDDEVSYSVVAPWPTAPNGGGESLTRLGVQKWGDDAASWAAAAPSPGTVIVTGTVVGRWLFYNNSAFDGGGDDAAVATDKQALLPGQSATFANYTSYLKGLNGIMVDIAGTVGNLSAADFTFKVGNDLNPAGWSDAPAPSITVRADQGLGGSDRVTLLWDDGAIEGKWLQVTVKATANTGLSATDVFYFGNAVGETGNDPANAVVDVSDELGARSHHTGFARVGATNPWDFNRDGRVNAADDLVARNHPSGLSPLVLLTAPAGAASLASVSAASARVTSDSVTSPGVAMAVMLVKSPAGTSTIAPAIVPAAAHDAVLTGIRSAGSTGARSRTQAAASRPAWQKWAAWLDQLDSNIVRPSLQKKERPAMAAVDAAMAGYLPDDRV